MLQDAAIIVGAEHGDQCAGVRRDADGGLWISHWTADKPRRVAGTLLEGMRPAAIRGPEWAALGGRLPESASMAEALGEDDAWHLAEAADGCWVLFVPYHQEVPGVPAVRFSDTAGAMVPLMNVGAAESRQLEAHEARLLAMSPSGLGGACPVCGSEAWLAKRAESGSGEIVSCARCGHSDGCSVRFWGAG
jgi:hypothetical protein